jgi:endoglucanase
MASGVGGGLAMLWGQVRAAGFTAIRLPVSSWTIHPGRPTASWASQYGSDGREVLLATILGAWNAQLWVLLDFHTYDPVRFPGGHAESPNDPDNNYSEARWISDLVALAEMARSYRNVVGIQLFNEPHNISWGQWRPMAERAGQAVLATHPGLITFISGVASAPGTFWGEDLTQAISNPIDPARIPAHKRAFIPHV